MAKAKEIWNTVSDAITAFINWISPIIQNFLEAVTGWWQAHGDQVIAAVEALWEGIKAAWAAFKAAFETAIELFHLAQQGDWRAFGEKLREIVDAIWEKIKEGATKAIEAIKTFFTTTDWGAVGTGIIKGIAAGITAGLTWLKNAAIAAAKAALEAAKGFLGIESPSKLFAEVGENMMKGMAMGISGNAGLPALATVQASSASLRAANSTVNNYYNLTANYQERDRQSLAMDIKMLAAMYG